MLQQLHRPARSFQGRSNRIRQPQSKEGRKTPVPRNVVHMLDGTHCPVNNFQDLRSNAHKKLKADFTGIAQRIRLGLADHGDAWSLIMDWIDANRPKAGTVAHQNDTLVATAIVYASTRFKRPVDEVISDIIRTGMSSVLFPVRQ